MSYRLFFVVPALLAISTSAAQSQDMRSWYCMDGCAETYAGDIDYCYEEYEEGSEEYEACIDQADEDYEGCLEDCKWLTRDETLDKDEPFPSVAGWFSF